MNSFYRKTSLAFGFTTTFLLAVFAIYLLTDFPSAGNMPSKPFFGKTQFDACSDAAKTLMPICTGYLLAIAPIIKYLQSNGLLFRRSIFFGMSLTFAFGIISFGLWTGVLAFLINASGALDVATASHRVAHYQFYNFSLALATKFGQFAHLSFFISILWFITTALLTLLEQHPTEASASTSTV